MHTSHSAGIDDDVSLEDTEIDGVMLDVVVDLYIDNCRHIIQML